MKLEEIGVVGCGLMGSGIAETCARAGYKVVVREIDDELLQKGLDRIQQSLSKAVARGKATHEEAEQAFARIQGTLDLADLGGCDLVVEAAVENMGIKKEIFAQLDSILPS
jgi:3-hydroxybutyryl-CoA dehydrogenase